jgi:hypothetical protein
MLFLWGIVMVRPSLSDEINGNLVSPQTLHGIVHDYGGLISPHFLCIAVEVS